MRTADERFTVRFLQRTEVRAMRCIRMLLLLLTLLPVAAFAENGAAWLPWVEEPMPVISIETADTGYATVPNRETKLRGGIAYVDAEISVSGCETAYRIDDAPAQVKARGNYTLEYPKKSIRIKFEDKQGMLGLHGGNAYKSWVLLAEWKDLSMTHSPVGFYLSHAILGSDGYYVTDCCNVEVWLNGEYWGVYLLAEQQEVKQGRTSLPEIQKDYTGTDIGYFFEYDAYFSEEKALPGGDPVFEVYHSGMTQEQYGYTIKSDIHADKQRRFLAAYVRRAYQLVYQAVTEGKHQAFNAKGTALTPIEGVSVEETVGQVLDLRSLVDTYILHEIVCNPDTGWSSFYITLDMTAEGNRKLTFEAPWDFDSCFGIRSGYESSAGLYVPGTGNPWLTLVAGEDWFQALVRERWAELKEAQVPETALRLILEHREGYAESYARNYERWPERIRDGNHELIAEVNAFRSQQEASEYFYRWLETRFAWLDAHWGSAKD